MFFFLKPSDLLTVVIIKDMFIFIPLSLFMNLHCVSKNNLLRLALTLTYITDFLCIYFYLYVFLMFIKLVTIECHLQWTIQLVVDDAG